MDLPFLGGENMKYLPVNEEVYFKPEVYQSDAFGLIKVLPDGKIFVNGGCDGKVRVNGEVIYNYELVGPKPVLGGDTYGAAAWLEDKLFFGGWVLAPVIYDRETNTISRQEKYAHVHSFNPKTYEINLIMKDSIHNKEEWAGEVSDLIADDMNNLLWICRGDGHKHLGLYTYDGKTVNLFNDYPALKGTIYLDNLIAIAQNTKYEHVQDNILLVNLRDFSVKKILFSSFPTRLTSDVDNENIMWSSWCGSIFTLANRVCFGTENSLIFGDPVGAYGLSPENIAYMLFVNSNVQYVLGWRCKPCYTGLGVLVPLNPFDNNTLTLRPTNPAILLLIKENMAKILMTAPFISAVDCDGSNIYIALSHAPYEAWKYNPYRTSRPRIIKLPIEKVLSNSPPLHICLWSGNYDPMGYKKWDWGPVANGVRGWIGGIPLMGYRKTEIIVKLRETNTLYVSEYDFNAHYGITKYYLNEGRNTLDLSSFKGFVALKFEKATELNAYLSAE